MLLTCGFIVVWVVGIECRQQFVCSTTGAFADVFAGAVEDEEKATLQDGMKGHEGR